MELKAVLEDDDDWLCVFLQDLLQETLEQEMTKVLAAAPAYGLRTVDDRDGHFSTELFARAEELCGHSVSASTTSRQRSGLKLMLRVQCRSADSEPH